MHKKFMYIGIIFIRFNGVVLAFGEGGWDLSLLMRLQSSLCTTSSGKYTLLILVIVAYFIILNNFRSDTD